MSKIVIVSRCAWNLYNFRKGQLRALQNEGHDVIGIAAERDGFEDKIEAMRIPFRSVPMAKRSINPFADIKLTWAFYRHYRRERPDLVHHYTIKPVIFGSVAARLARVPRVVNTVTGLGYAFSEEAPTLLRLIVERLYKFSLRWSQFVFFQNDDDRRLFIERRILPAEKTGLVPGSGVDTSQFKPGVPQELIAVEGPVTFLMVSRLLKDKGVYEYVEAARLVKREAPETRFLLVGRRDDFNPMVVPQEDLDRWQAEGIVRWLGEVDDVRSVLDGADVVVLPSFYREGTPRCLLEAAAMCKPIITTNSVGCREAVDDGVNGILVPIRDAPALCEAMQRMICNPEMRVKMGMAGREKMVREFDEAIVIERVLNVYASVA